jgi:hypothetical protein
VQERWAPQLGPQTEAITADWCDELLFGGAAGGGKSDFLLGDYLQDVPTYGKAWRGILFRRSYPALEELMGRAQEIYPQTGGKWLEGKATWRWPNGAWLRMRHIESDTDVTKYQGHQYAWIGWDELTQWSTLFAYRYLRGRLRSAHAVPTKRIRATANPGGVGHQQVKAYFIDPAPGGFTPILDPETGMTRMFVPSRLNDNRILLRNDPGYAGRLKGLGSDALVRAMLDGDWDVVEGAYFDKWSSVRNTCAPFAVPAEWARFRSFDWGYAKPFSVGWWAVASETCETEDGVVIPRGCMVRYREWYGCKEGEPNVGLRLESEAIADGIKLREAGEKIEYGVADTSIFDEDGGPSHAERMANRGVYWNRADKRRLPGWGEVRSRLVGVEGDDEDAGPMLVVFNTCRDFIRTVPALQHDSLKPEDLDSDGEDHVADEVRYACMSRPYVKEPRRDAPRRRYQKPKPKSTGYT